MASRRVLLLFAIIAALLGAPRPVDAASNSLTPLAPAPASGTTLTPFTFRAAYDGRFAAVGVVVEVAGLTVPMQLVVGSAERGTWSATTHLPVGTWTPSYRAVVVQGSAPVVTGAPIGVSPAAGTSATAAATPAGPGGGGPAPDTVSPDTPAGPSVALPAPTAAPLIAAPSMAPVPPPTSPAPAASLAPRPAPIPVSGGTAAPVGFEPAPGPSSPAAPAESGATPHVEGPTVPPGSGRPRGSEPTGPVGGAVGGAVDARHDDPGAVTPAAVTAIVVTGAAALLGAAVVLLARRRDATPVREPTTRALFRVRRPVSVPAEDAGADPTAALLDRRARRRAHVVLPPDPIVAAMGVDDPDPPDPPRPHG